jgi:Tol biopolymer transport system component
MIGQPDDSGLTTRAGLAKLAHRFVDIPYPTGLIAFETVRDGNREIYAKEYYDDDPMNLTNHPAEDHSFAWSPDGEWMAFLSDRTGAPEVYLMRPDGLDLRQLTANSNIEWNSIPAWSHTGNVLAITGAMPDDGEEGSLIYLIHLDGSGFVMLSSEPIYTGQTLKWSPDGEWIAYTEIFLEEHNGQEFMFSGDSGLKAISLDGARQVKLSGEENKIVGGFQWSPDGQQLAYLTNGHQNGYEYTWLSLANADGTEARNPTWSRSQGPNLPGDLAWSPDGSFITYVLFTEGVPELYLYHIESEYTTAMGFPAMHNIQTRWTITSRISWSPISRQILYPYDPANEYIRSIGIALMDLSPPDNNWLFFGYYSLDDSAADYQRISNPQWQPGP